MPEDEEEQHVVVVADHEAVLKQGVEECKKIIFADPVTKERIRNEQLKVGAEINATQYYALTGGKNELVEECMMTCNGPPNPNAYLVRIPDG